MSPYINIRGQMPPKIKGGKNMNLRDELYEEAMEARKNIRPKLVEEFLLEELHKSAKNGDFSCRIGVYAKLKDNKEITEEEISSFAKKHNLDKQFVDKPATGRWYILSYDKKKED